VLLGDRKGGHLEILDALLQRLADIVDGDLEGPRTVLLEGSSGMGKSRIVRELYARLRREDPYWPALETVAPEEIARDPLPMRKVIGPESFVWAAGALPTFAWWHFEGYRFDARGLSDAVAQARPRIEQHRVPLQVAWGKASSMLEKLGSRKDDIIEEVQQAALEGGVEAVGLLLAKLDIYLPGLGTGLRWLSQGASATKQAYERHRSFHLDEDLTATRAQSAHRAAEEVAAFITSTAHRDLPAVVAVEDLHHMDPAFGALLDHLTTPRAGKPILIVATAWPEARDRGEYARWRSAAEDTGRLLRLPVPYLNAAELTMLVEEYAPHTPPERTARLVARFPNPLALEATLTSRDVKEDIAAADGAAPEWLLELKASDLDAVYSDRFRQLEDETKFALGVAATSLPEDLSAWASPFIRSIVVAASARAGLTPADMDLLRGIQAAASDEVWLIPSAVSDRFRETLQAKAATAYLATLIRNPEKRLALRRAVVSELSGWVSERSSDEEELPEGGDADIVSAWLMALADITPNWSDDVPASVQLQIAYRQASRAVDTYRYEDAIAALTASLEVAPWPETLMSLRCWSLLAICHGALGHYDIAIPMAQGVLAPLAAFSGPADRELLATRTRIARWVGETNDYQRAVDEARAAVQEQATRLGESDPVTLFGKHHLSALLGMSGNLPECLELGRAVLEARSAHRDADDRDTLASRAHLVHWLGVAGRTEEALEMARALVDAQTRLLTAEHPDTLGNRNNYAGLLASTGEHERAISELRDVLASRERLLGVDHPDTLTTRSNLAHWLAETGETDEARAHARYVLDAQVRTLGADHAYTSGTRLGLAKLLT